jgi:hypothetical protein
MPSSLQIPKKKKTREEIIEETVKQLEKERIEEQNKKDDEKRKNIEEQTKKYYEKRKNIEKDKEIFEEYILRKFEEIYLYSNIYDDNDFKFKLKKLFYILSAYFIIKVNYSNDIIKRFANMNININNVEDNTYENFISQIYKLLYTTESGIISIIGGLAHKTKKCKYIMANLIGPDQDMKEKNYTDDNKYIYELYRNQNYIHKKNNAEDIKKIEKVYENIKDFEKKHDIRYAVKTFGSIPEVLKREHAQE